MRHDGTRMARAVQREAEKRTLVVVSGFIHDVGGFADQHPGGRALLESRRGRDATAAFCGGVYEHGNAAHNVRPLPFLPHPRCPRDAER